MYASLLKSVSLFSSLSDRQRGLIQDNLKKISFKRKSVILHQNENSYDLHIIFKGSVVITLIHEDGREVTLDTMKEGDFFGELSLLDHRPRSATVTALSDVDILLLKRDVFLETLRKHPDIAVTLLSVVVKRLRKANETIETLTFLDVSGRVAKLLMDTAKTSGECLENGCYRFICPTHQVISSRIGSSREAVTKTLKSFVANGLIRMKGREVVISPRQFELL